jgi:hypothetical protein
MSGGANSRVKAEGFPKLVPVRAEPADLLPDKWLIGQGASLCDQGKGGLDVAEDGVMAAAGHPVHLRPGEKGQALHHTGTLPTCNCHRLGGRVCGTGRVAGGQSGPSQV